MCFVITYNIKSSVINEYFMTFISELLSNIKDRLSKSLWIIILLAMFLVGSYTYFIYHSGEKSAEYTCLESGAIHTHKSNKKNYAKVKAIYDSDGSLHSHIAELDNETTAERDSLGVV